MLRSTRPQLETCFTGKIVIFESCQAQETRQTCREGVLPAAQSHCLGLYVLRATGALVPAYPCTTSRYHTARAALTCTHAEVFTLAVIFLRIGRTVPWWHVIRCRLRWHSCRCVLSFALYSSIDHIMVNLSPNGLPASRFRDK